MILISYELYLNASQVRSATPTIFKGEAVHNRQAIKPVVVVGVPHRKDAGTVAQQCAMQPAGDVPYLNFKKKTQRKPQKPLTTYFHSVLEVSTNSTYLWLQPSGAPAPPLRSSENLWTCSPVEQWTRRCLNNTEIQQQSKPLPLKLLSFLGVGKGVFSYLCQDDCLLELSIRSIRRNPPPHWLIITYLLLFAFSLTYLKNQRFTFWGTSLLMKAFVI